MTAGVRKAQKRSGRNRADASGDRSMSDRDRSAEVSPLYCGEWIRDDDLFVRSGGDTVAFQCVLPEKYTPGGSPVSVCVEGPDILKGSRLSGEAPAVPFGLVVYVSGKDLTEEDYDVDAVIEKSIPDTISEIRGVSWHHVRDQIEVRISREAVSSGLTLFEIGEILASRILHDFPVIGRVRVCLITDPETVSEQVQKARRVFEERDRKALSLHDEDVDTFFVCRMCQNACPDHICIITPDHPSVCGTISWTDARAAAKVNPDGPVSGFLKKKCLDPVSGEYEGLNETAEKETSGKVKRIALYDIYENPHTTGDCAEIIAYAVPEEGGAGSDAGPAFGLLDRQSGEEASNGLSFEELNGVTAGGKQISGFQGVGFTYLISPKFLQKNRGLRSVCRITESLRERLLPFLTEDAAEAVKRIPSGKRENQSEDGKQTENKKKTEDGKQSENGKKTENEKQSENENGKVRIVFDAAPDIINIKGKTIIRFGKPAFRKKDKEE